jgi:hypothetical protein
MSPARHHKPSPVTRILRTLASDLGIVIMVALVLIGVYFLDTITPLGQPVWLLYLIPLVLSYWSSRLYAIPAVCVVTLLFLIGGFFLSPEGVEIKQAILYRYTFFLVFISASVILWVIRRQQIGEENLI